MLEEWKKNARFKKALEFSLGHEGGYVNEPMDSGGATKYGISFQFLKDVRPDAEIEDIRNMTKDEAAQIYYDYFWNDALYSQIPIRLTVRLFDFGINMGQGMASRLLQRALRACGHDLKDDGIIGKITLKAIALTDEDILLPAFKSEAAGYYRVIATKYPKNKRFLSGWLNRAYSKIEM